MNDATGSYGGGRRRWSRAVLWAGVVVLAASVSPVAGRAESTLPPLKVVATTPDLGSLVQAVGGDDVGVTVLAKGPEDPHFVEARPSYIKALSEADLYLQIGMGLEAGYVPLLLQNARNARVLPGAGGYVDASAAITPMQVPTGLVDPSMGDVHPFGNPHYLLDPINGLNVARLIRDNLARIRPERAAHYAERYAMLEKAIGASLVGEELAARYDPQKLARLFEYGKLDAFLAQQGDANKLGGWLGRLAPYPGTRAVDDHNMWPYFGRRFGIDIVGHLEPKPGIPPTTSHLKDLVQLMRAQNVKLIFAAPYYDPRHARFVAEATGARTAYLAHQVGGRPGTDDYLQMIDFNVRTVADLLHGGS
ncbi:metal ABC transporter substrate-binding protein [Candidatus Binatia bacterium]|nr:metal ABC transporter substrate-binding protein [Candidatus Binatia bacterium]